MLLKFMIPLKYTIDLYISYKCLPAVNPLALGEWFKISDKKLTTGVIIKQWLLLIKTFTRSGDWSLLHKVRLIPALDLFQYANKIKECLLKTGINPIIPHCPLLPHLLM